MEKNVLASTIIEKVGGKENVKSVTHCMTRLRFILNDINMANQDEIKALDDIMGVVYKGGQLQLIIGPQVTDIYDEVMKIIPMIEDEKVVNEIKEENIKKDFKYYLNEIMGTLAGCMTPMIPVLLCMGICKAIVAVLGPQLMGVLSETDSLYVLFTFVGDAGLYFIPIYVGYTAAKKFGMNELMGMFLGAILIHPTLIQMATDGTKFNVYGIPASVQNYSSSIIPIILTIWVASYVEKFFKKYTPDVLKVFGIPLGTLLIMLPLELCLFGPLGAFIGEYICQGIIGLYDIAGPLAVGIVGATFGLLVLTGMHTVLMAFLFMTFPMIGYDGFIIPAIMACSYAGAGVTLACMLKFKDKKKKQLTLGYFVTWLFGGVGEPMLYGLNIPYRTPLYAGMISGFLAGVVTGLLGLKAYVPSPSNGLYILPAFLGGPQSNYIVLVISLVISVVIGFVVMWFMKLDESLVK
ncbi:PTS transporter subunit EIIC [Candidatus Stoquefichus massiliensis]|uniref:PTS transporter subunit EIIC n=1 Tax=Candidatus Stoquefichus massiliensis TaxID=1470350 RepID=UPI0004B724E0|nr:PTS transporter subunit EIIC [Candidatus Stoquefichus massiliensis]